MKAKILYLTALLAVALWPAKATFAQTTEEVDSLMVSGIIENLHTGQPQPFSTVRFLQDDKEMARATCDSAGEFSGITLAPGRYLLFVGVNGLTVQYADVSLADNSFLSLQVDTVKIVTLKEMTVMGMKHMLNNLLISSPHDRRLWGFTAGYRDASASIANPPDAH